jgi:hypothetical protein
MCGPRTTGRASGSVDLPRACVGRHVDKRTPGRGCPIVSDRVTRRRNHRSCKGSCNELRATTATHEALSGVNGNGKTPETGMIGVLPAPEAGAQVRILPGAPHLTS